MVVRYSNREGSGEQLGNHDVGTHDHYLKSPLQIVSPTRSTELDDLFLEAEWVRSM